MHLLPRLDKGRIDTKRLIAGEKKLLSGNKTRNVYNQHQHDPGGLSINCD